MRIAINGMFWNQPTVGSGQYLRGLLAALLCLAPQHEYILLYPARRATVSPGTLDQSDPQAELWSKVHYHAITTPFDARNKNAAKLWYEQIGVPHAAVQLHSDLLHVPYFAPPLYAKLPVVVTVLDIIPLLLPEYRGSRAVRAYMRLVAHAARYANHIIAISDASRSDIINYLGCKPNRVTTVPLAAGTHYFAQDREQAAQIVAERYGLHGPFVYYVGGLDARKNVPTLLRAWQRLRRSGGPAATLVIAGRALGDDPRMFPDINAFIAELGIADSVRRIDVPHADNALLYNAATIFAFPSRYEGFGLPPLEAMACGTPCVVSNASSLPEVVGNAALHVHPDDVSGWAAALWRLLADASLRDTLRERGFARAAQLNYAHAAQKTLNIYTATLALR